MEDLINIGYTNKAHGLNGDIKLKIKDAFLEDLNNIEIFFLKKGGSNIPYFLESLRTGNAIIAKFEDVDNRVQAEKLESKALFARLEDIKTVEGENPELKHLEYGFLIDFTLIDEQIGDLGIIKEILDYPHQEMAVFEFRSKEQLLPLNEHFIREIDQKNQKVIVALPDGLLDL